MSIFDKQPDEEELFDRWWRESASLTVGYEEILQSPLTVWTSEMYVDQFGCRRCGHPYGWIGRYIMTNGRTQVRWVCQCCGDYGTFGSLPVKYIASMDLSVDDLPLVVDRSGEYMPGEPCCVCGSLETEQHHWAPSSIFPDADWWRLTVPLCVIHHREWHARMREHGLRWPRELVAR